MSLNYLERNTLIIQDGESFIIFSPFSRNITRVQANPKEDTILYEQLQTAGFFQDPPAHTKKRKKWDGFHSITLFLTRGCNLGCRYCYAKARPYAPGMSMQREFALKSVDWFIRQLGKDTIRLTFFGGGEPTLEHETIKAVYDHVEAVRGQKQIKYLISSNGTAPKDFLNWMMDRSFSINFSVDGHPNVQNRNRPFADGSPSSDVVESNIRHIINRGYPLSVRMTFSKGDDITNTLKYFASLGVTKIHVEPLFPYGREYSDLKSAGDHCINQPEEKELLNGFITALEVSKQLNISIYNGHLVNFMRGAAYFCAAASGRAAMITHDGFLSGCIEVTDGKDAFGEHFIIGEWDENQQIFIVDHNKIQQMLIRHPDETLALCKNCIGRLTCAGGCAVKALRRTRDILGRDLPFCAFTKGMIPELVKRIATESKI